MSEHQREAIRLVSRLLAGVQDGFCNGDTADLAPRAEAWLLAATIPRCRATQQGGTMSMDTVRRTYGVPAKRGLRVTVDGRPGVITRATHYVYVRFDGTRHARPCHPTWRIDYAPPRATPPEPTP